MSSTVAPRRPRAAHGFTLVEVVTAMALLTVLVVSVLAIATETSVFVSDTETDYSVQAEANRAYTRMAEVLRKSGWNTAGGITYPRVISAGAALEFRGLRDLDGNGHAFNATTGELEWSPLVFTIRLDESTNTLGIYSGTQLVRTLGRHIQRVGFATYLQNNTLHLKEIQVTIETERSTRRGDPLTYASTSSIYMRN